MIPKVILNLDNNPKKRLRDYNWFQHLILFDIRNRKKIVSPMVQRPRFPVPRPRRAERDPLL